MIIRKAHSWGYLVIWEFRIRPRTKRLFLKAYGPKGEWAKLFARDKHYAGTDLIQHFKLPQTYWTLDYWASRRAYENFKKAHAKEYKRIDAQCENLTKTEREAGTFLRPG